MSGKTCSNCRMCARIYRKFYLYSKYKLLYCTYAQAITKPNDTCGQWQRKPCRPGIDLSPQRFDAAVKDIERIKQILKD